MKDLTNSNIDRQNILNNRFALEKIQKYIGLSGILFEGEYRYTTQMVANFYSVDERTVKRYLENYEQELKHNGYILSKGKQLIALKLQFGHVINVPSKTTQLGLFNFRAFLNLGMLMSESENAKLLRSKMLDIVIETINERTGGGTKYINRKDADYLPTAIRESKYRKEFTSALSRYIDMGNYKYSLYTDKIYQCIFKENAQEYKQILRLEAKENARDTMYAEILNMIASFETGIAYEIEKCAKNAGRKLQPNEVDEIFIYFSEHPLQRPHIEDARIKMASRDLHFRDAFHKKLEEYIHSISPADFERFIGEQSVNFDEQLEEAKDVFQRLKESE
ncbi:MAG: DNA-binding protein [Bacteroidetes bacterium GWF2_42_66]|nr:MAG: DNA-binding protein [Bacteroidetes bacterium GWA2_42_15]OFX97111.1 MAG: DNA-binding protein [Bacteroidetes bacterium GWE2_42_39]OFY46182.1 MAG: DNA-binding protein [Bacteroidetes bacterium GWF2_42_66]HBL78052.1 DNA-binding protein [Prolixibacteraceae bacterium]HCR89858.1 DNA-binding protein [Prolixibacteraceae bacterium]